MALIYCCSDKSTGGGKKKVALHQKWFTWIIMAINNKNVNKSNVVFTCVAVCKPKQYIVILSEILE